MSDSKQRKLGSQGIIEVDVARGLGRDCPVGREVEFALGLTRFWPDMQQRPQAMEALLEGMANRFSAMAS